MAVENGHNEDVDTNDFTTNFSNWVPRAEEWRLRAEEPMAGGPEIHDTCFRIIWLKLDLELRQGRDAPRMVILILWIKSKPTI